MAVCVKCSHGGCGLLIQNPVRLGQYLSLPCISERICRERLILSILQDIPFSLYLHHPSKALRSLGVIVLAEIILILSLRSV